MRSRMMTLGLFVFGMDTLAYQDFKRSQEWRHPSQARIGVRPGSQFLGPGDDKITLSGWYSPEISQGLVSLETLRTMADMGESWPLIEGTGRIYGFYVIESLEEGRTIFLDNGAAQRTEFTLALKRAADQRLSASSGQRIDPIGNLISLGLAFLR